MTISAGRFIDYTHVGWLDVILNAVFFVNVVGLSFWIAWGIKERRRGVRGAIRKAFEQSGHANGWKPRTRWIMAGVAMAGALAVLLLGAILTANDESGGHTTMAWGGIYAGLWLLAGPLLRPVSGPRPQHAKEWAEPGESASGSRSGKA